MDADGFDAFASSNLAPLATAGATLACARHLWRPQPTCRLAVHTDLDARAIVVRHLPPSSRERTSPPSLSPPSPPPQQQQPQQQQQVRLSPGFDDGALNAIARHTPGAYNPLSKPIPARRRRAPAHTRVRAPGLRGIVLSLYGTGNGPTGRPSFVSCLRAAIENDIIVVAVTQCARGAVSIAAYDAGLRLLEARIA